MRVLIIESPLMPGSLTNVLAERGYDMTVCKSSEEGWARYLQNPFPLVFYDVRIADASNYFLCYNIRLHKATTSTYVVVWGWSASFSNVEHSLRAGANDVVAQSSSPELIELRLKIIESSVAALLERKIIEEALLNLKGNVFYSTDAIIAQNLGGTILGWNPSAEQIFGFTAEEAIGRHISLIDSDAHKEVFENAVERLEAGEKILTYDTVRRTKSGHRLDLSISVSPVNDETGKLVGVTLVARDSTEKKNFQNLLLRSEVQLKQLFESKFAGILFWRKDGQITGANDAALEMLQYGKMDVLDGKLNWKNLTPQEFHGLDMLAMRQVDEFGECDVYEKELIRFDGSRIQVLIGASFDSRSETGAAIILDLTSRRKLEQQLRQSQKLEGIGKLAGGIAHDFNNLLTVILGRSDLLLSRMDQADPGYVGIRLIHTTAMRAAKLTRQLLQFSRQQVLQPKPLNLNEVIMSMLDMLRRLIGENIEVTTRLDQAVKFIEFDPSQIEQVLLNLILNARDAMPTGGVLTIETQLIDINEFSSCRGLDGISGPHAILIITDTGTGMDSATMSQIFDPFYTTKKEGEGTGLGLATVQGIVKQSGGSITVYSEPGKGSTFKLYFKHFDECGISKSFPVVPLPNRNVTETILIVEDEEGIRDLLSDILSHAGYNTLCEPNGLCGLNRAKEHRNEINLVISDLVMPKMSGQELADQLLVLMPHVPLLFISGYTSNSNVQKGLLLKGEDFLDKPFLPDTLLKKVHEILERRHPAVLASQELTPALRQR
jgi:two-component system, cell cycle sensor histidine kinase and response regulator CckA